MERQEMCNPDDPCSPNNICRTCASYAHAEDVDRPLIASTG